MQVFVNVVVSVQYQVRIPAHGLVSRNPLSMLPFVCSVCPSVQGVTFCRNTGGRSVCTLAGMSSQVERDNLYSAFYKLTDSSRQITSFVYDCSASRPSAICSVSVYLAQYAYTI